MLFCTAVSDISSTGEEIKSRLDLTQITTSQDSSSTKSAKMLSSYTRGLSAIHSGFSSPTVLSRCPAFARAINDIGQVFERLTQVNYISARDGVLDRRWFHSGLLIFIIPCKILLFQLFQLKFSSV